MAKKKTKQGHLDGMEPPSIKAIDAAAEAYVETRDERMNLTKQEIERHDAVIALMQQHGLSTYEFDGYVVTLNSSTKAKVSRKKEPEDDFEVVEQ